LIDPLPGSLACPVTPGRIGDVEPPADVRQAAVGDPKLSCKLAYRRLPHATVEIFARDADWAGHFNVVWVACSDDPRPFAPGITDCVPRPRRRFKKERLVCSSLARWLRGRKLVSAGRWKFGSGPKKLTYKRVRYLIEPMTRRTSGAADPREPWLNSGKSDG
jgi:hypothetical protein